MTKAHWPLASGAKNNLLEAQTWPQLYERQTVLPNATLSLPHSVRADLDLCSHSVEAKKLFTATVNVSFKNVYKHVQVCEI